METIIREGGSDVGLPQLPQLRSPVSFRPALAQLHKHRTETTAIRELWQSLAEKRQRRQQHLQALLSRPDPKDARCTPEAATQEDPEVNHANNLPNDCSTDSDAVNTGPEHGKPTDDDASTEPRTRLPPPFPSIFASCEVNTLLQRPYRSAAVTSPRHGVTSSRKLTPSRRQRGRLTSPADKTRQDDVRSPVPYHTAITRRPVARKGSPRFQALTQSCSSPLPHLMEGQGSRSFTARPGRDGSKRNIRDWQNEIVKVVPSRPVFVQPLPNGVRASKVTTWRYPYKVLNPDPQCHFYRSWAKVTDKDFIISPEWSSEKRLRHSRMGPRAKTDLS